MIEDVSTPAIVLGCYKHGGLAVVRTLGRLGVPVYVVHDGWVTAGAFSRYCRGRFHWELNNAKPEASIQFLMQVHERIGRRALLIPTSDIAAMFVADHAVQLGAWFAFPEQDAKLTRSLCSKKDMYYLARQWNVPAPETAFPQSVDDVAVYLKTARFPVLLKPIIAGRKIWPITLVHSRQELLEHYQAVEDPLMPNVMLQEYIPGGDEMAWVFNGYFDRCGECRVAFTGRKLRNYRPYFGMASLGLCIHNEQVLNTTIAFMKAIGYRGPLDLGYRYDARDGCYKIYDINPRVGAMFRCFVGANDMDVVRALYQDMTGQAVVPATTVEGRKWVVEDCDWISALRYWRDGKLTPRGWRDSLRGIAETSYIARDDLLPVVGAIAYAITVFFNRGRQLWRQSTEPTECMARQRPVA
ncbi:MULTISPECIES: carboxylate--amine ligase [Bradyrhizobium]|uniref:carboxylate--amine ligase n=1 Tax=Bradyrhizobium elkanii TaxID=29448 RepID=UPI0003F65587|nr:carboxylate--amine ligase [Bradyrhizobium elkanii]